jgi:elongator complex protein 1
MIASIDGRKLTRMLLCLATKINCSQVSLKLTPLRLANIPPPMSMHTLKLEHKAIDAALSQSGNRLAVLSEVDLAVYALDLNKRPMPKPLLLWRSDAIKLHSPRHALFVGDDQIYILTDDWDEDESCLWRSDGENLVLQGPITEASGVSSLVSNVDYESLYVQLQNGALQKIHTDGVATDLPPQTSLIHQFPTLAPEVKICTIEQQVRSSHLFLTFR